MQGLFLNYSQWNCYKFYRRYKGCELCHKQYDLDCQRLFSVLYAMGYRRVKQGRSFDYYKEMVLSACCEDKVYAGKFMKLVAKYECESGLELIAVSKGKKQYFVDFVGSDEKEDVVSDNNDGAVEG